VALLEALGSEYGFRVAPFDLVVQRSLEQGAAEVVSSTRVRACIAAGELDEAARLLGRAHEVRGVVCEDGAIAVPAEIMIPPAGHYVAGVARLDPASGLRPAEVVVGPTSSGGVITVPADCPTAPTGAGVRVVFEHRA
jgi:riboflavin kinase/FMN adenylyltransferase